jgi:hypothetical protein
MWIALGVVGVLWFVGYVVVPDKNAPGQSHAHSAPTEAAAPAAGELPPPAAH